MFIGIQVRHDGGFNYSLDNKDKRGRGRSNSSLRNSDVLMWEGVDKGPTWPHCPRGTEWKLSVTLSFVLFNIPVIKGHPIALNEKAPREKCPPKYALMEVFSLKNTVHALLMLQERAREITDVYI